MNVVVEREICRQSLENDRANATRRDKGGDASLSARALWRDVYLTEPRVLRRSAVGSFAFFKLVKP